MTKDFNHLCIFQERTLSQALQLMDSTGHKLLIVTNEIGRFVSLLSVGDIQRAIIKGFPLISPIKDALRSDITVAHVDDDLENVKERMRLRRNEFMPVINSKHEIVSVIMWEDLFATIERKVKKNINLPVVIMAGGVGTRLRPLTNVIPKPLIPINERSLIEEIFERFGVFGCTNFYISVNYKANLLVYYLESLNLPYKLHFFTETKPLGTAGSLSLIKSQITKTFFVSNCDILIEQDYGDVLDYHNEAGNDLTIIAVLKTLPVSYGLLESGINGQLKKLIEKPELTLNINSGMYILEPSIFNYIPDDTFYHISDLIHALLESNCKIGVYPVSEKSWIDIGTWDEYIKNINKDYAR